MCNFGIVEKYQGQGMATTMFDLILQDAKKRNVSSLVCDVSINNDSAKKLYEEIWGLKL